jgi:hypothetical protein
VHERDNAADDVRRKISANEILTDDTGIKITKDTLHLFAENSAANSEREENGGAQPNGRIEDSDGAKNNQHAANVIGLPSTSQAAKHDGDRLFSMDFSSMRCHWFTEIRFARAEIVWLSASVRRKSIHMKRILFSVLLVGVVVSLSAQIRGPSPGVNAQMLKMFGDTKAFSANAEARVLDRDQKEISAMPMTMAMRDGKLRSEMDVSQVKGSAIPPEAAAMMKQAGMDKMVTLILPDKKTTLISYPGLQSYAEMRFSEEDASDEKLVSTEAGKESIDGHPCTKTKLTSTDAKGKTHEAFIWQATDLKKFPIQMQMAQSSQTLIVKFQPPRFEQPDAALFEPPAGYTKYPSIQALMQAAMMKMFGGAQAK